MIIHGGMPIKGMPLLLFCTIIIINTTTMTVKEIFDHPAVKAVEIEILDTIRDEERCRKGEDAKLAVQHLLSVRKRILNGMFEWTDEYYSLLSEFNKALVEAQCEMRERLFRLSESVKETGLENLEFQGKVFMSYKYSEIHPVQSVRATKMWNVLNGSYDEFIPLYKDGVNSIYFTGPETIPSEKETVYISEETENWNEGLDREKTRGMKLCYAFHNLYEHTTFSILDLLWVRDFYIDINAESSHYTGSDDCDDIDWKDFDYND